MNSYLDIINHLSLLINVTLRLFLELYLEQLNLSFDVIEHILNDQCQAMLLHLPII